MGSIGRDKVDQRFWIFDVLSKVDPAVIWLELAVAGAVEKLTAGFVQRRNPGVATTGEIDRSEVERQAQQIVTQRLGDELVDFIANLARQSANDGGSSVLGCGTTGSKRERIEE